MNKYVLDACAIVAVLNEEKGAESVRDLIDLAGNGSIAVYMNAVNLLEVYYGIYKAYDKDTAEDVLVHIYASPIEIVETVSVDILREAGRLKSLYKISLADSFAIAQASILGGTLVTSDHHEIDIVDENEDIAFQWFR